MRGASFLRSVGLRRGRGLVVPDSARDVSPAVLDQQACDVAITLQVLRTERNGHSFSPLTRRHLLVEPRDQAHRDVAAVLLAGDRMALTGVDDEPCRDAEGFQRVPELEGLGRRALAVT